MRCGNLGTLAPVDSCSREQLTSPPLSIRLRALMFDTERALLKRHFRFSRNLARRMSVLMLLLAAVPLAAFCSSLPEAAGDTTTTTASTTYNGPAGLTQGTVPHTVSNTPCPGL